jgi:catechol 2,3-dioxygenase-like lactoylglutathione lyase family enzyme
MLDHVSIGVKDIARAKTFYDAALQPLGVSAKYADGGSLGYGASSAYFWVNQVEAPVVANPKSGLHFCFVAPTRAGVDAFHAAAMRAGGRDNGAPGLRADYGPNYYAAFVVDPDGYRIEAYCGAES